LKKIRKNRKIYIVYGTYVYMDEKDKKILKALEEDGSLTTRQVARLTGVPLTTVFKRIKLLKDKKIIKRYTIELDHDKIGKPIAVYILVSADIKILKEKERTQKDVKDDLLKISAIDKVDIVTGPQDLIIHARLGEIKELKDILLDQIQGIHGVSSTKTSIVIDED